MSTETDSQTSVISTQQRFDLFAVAAAVGLALAFRLPGLTVFITADEARSWFGRSIIFLDSLLRLDFANTAPGGEALFIENVSLSPAPGVTTMWTGTIGIILAYLHQGMAGSLADFLVTIPFDPLDPAMLFYLRLPTVLLTALAVGLTYGWGRSLLGRWGAVLAAVFIALDPFYLALSRVLGHDALVTTFMWLSLLAFLRFVQQRMAEDEWQIANSGSYKSGPPLFLVFSGAFAGLAFLSKYPALFIGAFITLTLLIIDLWQWTKTKKEVLRSTPYALSVLLKNWLVAMLIWSAAAGVVFVLFWPSMWVHPVTTMTTILNDALRASGGSHPKGSFFLGQPVPDPGNLFYLLIILLRTTPVTLMGLLLAVGGLVAWGCKVARSQGRRGVEMQRCRGVNLSPPDPPKGGEKTKIPPFGGLGGQEPDLELIHVDAGKQGSETTPHAPRPTPYVFFILLAYILLYTLLVTYGGKKQDRYVLPAFPAIDMLAAFGLAYVLAVSKRIVPVILVAVIFLQAILIFPAYPYYFSFYNPLAGGGAVAERIIQVGWGEGLDEAAAYLNTLPGVETAKAVSWYSTAFEPYFAGEAIYKIEDEKISRSAKPGLAADYVIFYINQVQRQLPSEGALQYFRTASPLYTVTLQGIDYAWIYPSVGMAHVLANEVRLVGQAELLGYDLTSEAGEPVNVAYPESVVLLSLYWEWQGKAPDEPLGLSLVDEAGKTRGWGNSIDTLAPLPYEQWQEGMIVRDDFALVIFPDTSPGEYRLASWISRPATGETVGVFPLEDKLRIVPRDSTP